MEIFMFVYINMKFSCRPCMGGNLEQFMAEVSTSKR